MPNYGKIYIIRCMLCKIYLFSCMLREIYLYIPKHVVQNLHIPLHVVQNQCHIPLHVVQNLLRVCKIYLSEKCASLYFKKSQKPLKCILFT